MAAAPVPAEARRVEDDGAIVLRWIDDPSDFDSTLVAARRHEAWLAPLLETRLVRG
jgi:hypothetical protein